MSFRAVLAVVLLSAATVAASSGKVFYRNGYKLVPFNPFLNGLCQYEKISDNILVFICNMFLDKYSIVSNFYLFHDSKHMFMFQQHIPVSFLYVPKDY